MKISFLKIESYKKGIAISSAFNFISKLLVFAQSVLIAFFFGTHAATDVYFYCFATITLLGVFVNSLDSSVLIPESMRLREQEGEQASFNFLNFFILLYVCAGVAMTAILYVCPISVLLTVSNFDYTVLVANKEIILFSIPLFTLIIVTNLLVNILTSYKFFTIPMIIGVVNGITVLVFLFLLHDPLQIRSVLVGHLIAYLVNLVFLMYLMRAALAWKFDISTPTISMHVAKNIFFAQAGNITSVLSSFIGAYLLSGFSPGIITSLTFGQRTAEMPHQLITMQSSSIIGIKLNELYARKDAQNLDKIFTTSAEVLFFILTPVSGLLLLFNEEVIQILFERGAFNSDSVETSAAFFKYFAMLLPMLAINTLVARLFMAGQKIKQAFVYQVVFNCALATMIFFGVKLIGDTGYPIALIALHVINVMGCYFLLQLYFPSIRYGRLLIKFIRILLLNVFILALVSYESRFLENLHEIVRLTIGCVSYISMVVIGSFSLRTSEEVNLMIRKGVRYVSFAVRTPLAGEKET
jgi:putative peptidoglycan lipid II flippase